MMLSTSSPEWDKFINFEKLAKMRWGSYITKVEKKVILKANALAKGITPATALDIGCDRGRWSKLLVDLGWDMVCTEINPDTLAICQRRIPTAKCILVGKDDTTLPCKTESLGLLLCIEVTPVLESEWFITEAYRVLHPGGLIIGVFLNKLSLRGYFRHLVDSATGKFDWYGVSYPSWRRKFFRQGFKMIYEEGICWFPFRRGSNSPLVSIFTQIEHSLGLRHLPSLSPRIVFLAQREKRGCKR